MKKFARIENQRVMEIVKHKTIVDKYHPSLVFVEIAKETVVKVGYIYKNDKLTEPIKEENKNGDPV